jgi:hypothetical protein
MKRRLLNTTTAITAVLALTGPFGTNETSARTAAAMIGRASNGPQDGCFNTNFDNGFVQNICPGTIRFQVPLVVDHAGGKTVIAVVSAPNTAATSCRAVGLSKFATAITSSGTVNPSVAGAPVEITMTGATVPGGGFLFLICDIGENAAIASVNYGA